MQKKYYSINETLVFLSRYGLTLEIISSLTREKIIHPIICINSMPAHACEEGGDGSAIAVGYCVLLAYWDLGKEMTAILDGIVRDGDVIIRPLVKREHLVGEPEILSWQYDDYVFKRVPPSHAQPKVFSERLDIKYFILISEVGKPVSLKLTNLVISVKDFEYLKLYLCAEEGSPLLSGKAKDRKRSQKVNPVMELIKELHSNSPDKSPRAIWDLLKTRSLTDDPIVQEVGNWLHDDAKVYWKSQTGKERSFGRPRFENIISTLNASS